MAVFEDLPGPNRAWLLRVYSVAPRPLLSLFMAALCDRAGRPYIFSSCRLFFLLLFFPRLISAVADWMSTILPHMVWP